MENSKKTYFNMITNFAKGVKRYFFVAVFAAAVSIFFNFLLPQIVGFTVDSIIGEKVMKLPNFIVQFVDRLGGREYIRANLILCAAVVIFCAVISGISNYFSRTNLSKAAEGFAKNLRDALFTHTQKLPFSWHTKNQTGDIIQRCTSDVETARDFVSKQLIEVLRTGILVTMALIIMFSMNVIMALLVFAFIPLIFLYTTFFYGKISRQFQKADEAEGELMVQVQENLTGVRVVRAFGREHYEMERFDQKNQQFARKWIDLGYTLGVYWGVGDIVSACQLLSVVTAGAYFAAKGTISIGELLIFITYSQTIAWPVRQLGRTLSEMSKTGVSLKRMKEILDAPAEMETPNAKRPPLDRDIVFDHVRFSYDDQMVLEDISFSIKSGTTFGILGATGSGKSTITYLLNRLFDLDEDCGTITIGGVNIQEIDRYYLRKNVGLVLQEPFLFSKTIHENIAIASKSANMERIREKAKIAAVDDNIMEFAMDYETVVGERGVTLSGGQKQRIAIARTLMMDAPIMIFDDSMSNLDMETDARIRDALREHTKKATVILISHRINTLMQADKILVIEQGEIKEFGSHDELLKKDGIYRRVYNLQSGYEEGGEL